MIFAISRALQKPLRLGPSYASIAMIEPISWDLNEAKVQCFPLLFIKKKARFNTWLFK